MRRPLVSTVAILAAVAVLGLAGCSKAAQSAPLSPADQTSAVGGSAGAAGGAAGGRGQFPGVAGLVAAVTGSTAQVQGSNQQTAVTWTSTTRFTAQAAASASALAVGECVMARPARPAGGVPGGAPTTAANAGSGSPAPATSVAAATVQVFAKQGGSCSLSLGNRTGSGASGTPSSAPGGSPTGSPGGAADGVRRAFGAVGMITAVGAGEFTVSPTVRLGAMPTRPVTVTYTSSTVFTRLSRSAASAVKVGVCLSAQGRTDDTGALTAAAVTVSAPTKGTCQTGFGRGFGGGQGAGQGSGAGRG
ncbi:hypothetical protein FHX52_1505 [Humibacillus xanthopallidus]|uniref:DUF5666 domain-containing protein n=1 Tax=Humibacillus xanthopallidus TaxID=412689 RepID=A0A543PWC8_9MICO|nr:DUF5666 domain-containing protein [Humibacillus xanthopallidus]TQN48374.1 hypothetical protein FHX52_1505 [Humibacillus xanthopallidus]